MRTSKRIGFLKTYRDTFITFLMYVCVVVYPVAVNQINKLPGEKDLVQLNVKILNIQDRHPNLIVEFENGSVEYIEFPSAVYDPIRGFSHSVHFVKNGE